MVKKIVLFTLITCWMAVQLTAQNDREYRFGIQASPTFSWMSTDERLLENAGTNWGFKLALMAEKYFQPNYAIVSGIGFGFNHGGFLQSNFSRYRPWVGSDLSIKLTDSDSMSLPASSKLHYRLRYVEVPLGLKMRGGSNEDAPLKFFAEPLLTFGFLTKALGDISGAGSEFNTTDENIRNDVNGLALSWGLGAGVEYELATHTTFVAGLFYQNNFTDLTQKARAVRDVAGNWENEQARTYFRALTLRLGLFF